MGIRFSFERVTKSLFFIRPSERVRVLVFMVPVISLFLPLFSHTWENLFNRSEISPLIRDNVTAMQINLFV